MTRGFLRFLRGNTIALLALFLALGGTTYAASTALIGKNTVASPQVVNGSLKAKDLSKAARRTLKGNRGLRGFTGAQGPKGATGAQGAQGTQGIQGVQGVPGEAVAYALVNSAGAVDAAHSKNVTSANVRHPGAGQYCFHGLAFTPINVQVTLGGVASALPVPQVLGGASEVIGGFCNQPGDQAGVFVWNQAGSATVDYPFHIWFE
jgi:hypothetical protein